ncbi:MAG: Rne/Rng family ribonuclease [Actinomycetota bacterium]|nr:Rne/Rng family ribonuclease [Actinomycetota bacterium]
MTEEVHGAERPADVPAPGPDPQAPPSDDEAPTAEEAASTRTGEQRRRPRRRRGGSRSRSRTAEPRAETNGDQGGPGAEVADLIAGETEAVPDATGDGELAGQGGGSGDGATTTTRPRRRRRSRSGSRSRQQEAPPEESAEADTPEKAATIEVPEAPEAPIGEAEPQDPAVAPGEPTVQRARRRRRRRGRRGGSRSTGELEERVGEELEVETTEPPEDAAAAPESPEKEKAPQVRRMRPRTAAGRRRRERPPEVRRVTDKVMLITEIGERDQIAVLEGRTLVEHYITRSGAHSMVGNVYLGKVQNVLPGMEAAFVDVGKGRNAVLYAGEVAYDEDVDGESPRIEQVLKPGHNVMVQVTKDPMGGKGARLTQEVSVPGRFLVLVPNSEVFGISRRLPERERTRLKDILKKVRPPQHGLIVRTAAEGASPEDLRADLERLAQSWERIEKSAKRGRAPRLLYEEPELTVRVVRDVFTGGEFKQLITDSAEVYERVVGYLRDVAPELVPRVEMHAGPLPLLEQHHVVEQIHKALERKVWLPSGGYLVIDRSEAMTVIDVNTGKHVGTANLEETVTKTNMEAAVEIARQLRLRDIGGIIIIDFIDMLFERNRDKVIQALKDAVAQDKTRSQVFDITPLGLLEMTRKRVSAGLVESFSETCPTCEGRGIILTHKL